MEWRMLAITCQGDKADIRHFVGQDWACGRKSATSLDGLARV
ncbi:hypothetical protein M2394_003139 [Pseudomonas sp. BIGb0164]|jgi:hypothetical protein|nr:hypothetical protein [Pseudomonas sp. BIGb0164]